MYAIKVSEMYVHNHGTALLQKVSTPVHMHIFLVFLVHIN